MKYKQPGAHLSQLQQCAAVTCPDSFIHLFSDNVAQTHIWRIGFLHRLLQQKENKCVHLQDFKSHQV